MTIKKSLIQQVDDQQQKILNYAKPGEKALWSNLSQDVRDSLSQLGVPVEIVYLGIKSLNNYLDAMNAIITED